jgi:hypothetical protein
MAALECAAFVLVAAGLPPSKLAARVNSWATEPADEAEPSAIEATVTKAITRIARNVCRVFEVLGVKRNIRVGIREVSLMVSPS